MPTPLEVAQAEIGQTNAERYWGVVWPDRPPEAVNWCGCFVTFCFAGAGQDLPKIENAVTSGFVFVPDEEGWGKQNSDWFTSVARAAPGDIVLYDWNGDGVADHTGIVESVFSDGSIVAIEGNTGSPVGVYRQARKANVILGFVRPGGLMARKGCDSAYAPSVAQVQQAIRDGVNWWVFYCTGAGALHNWSAGEVNNLRAGGLNDCLPVFVPRLVSGRIDPNANPEADARAFVQTYQAFGVNGAGALDTEASMRGDPWTATYTQRFCAELRALNQEDVCYAGGFTMGSPPQATHLWWIVASQNPPSGQCYQYGSGTEGVSVDYDSAADSFPLASLHYASQPAPAPYTPQPVVITNDGDLENGEPMQSTTLTIPTDGDGNGWVMLDGSDARVGHFVLPYGQSLPPDRQGSNPARDKTFWVGTAHRNNTGGHVCLSVANTGVKNGLANVNVSWIGTLPAAPTAQEAQAHFGAERIITHENWQSFDPQSFGGGAHDPANATDQPAG